jgi:hypothetical protein
MFAFLSLLFVLLVIYFFTTINGTNEGFDPLGNPPEHKVLIPSSKIPVSIPPANATKEANVKAHELPGQLPVAPYGQIAAMSPLPYQDTSLIKANRQQMVSLLEMLKGFLAFEAQSISEKSDPSIQLPLSTLRSDFHLLQSEVEVLNRNPGIQPNITLAQLNEMTSNMQFLKRAAHLAGSAGAIQGPIDEFTKEGFQSMQDSPANSVVPATLSDLQEFTGRIQGEILRLSASGTTDPIMNARVNALTKMKADVVTIIDQVQKGIMMEVEIPIMKSDIDKSLPILGKPSEPLPQLIKAAELPAGLANMLPSNVQKDPETTKQIGTLMDKYAQQFVNGLSASFNISYSPPSHGTGDLLTQERKRASNSTVDQSGFPSSADLKNAAGNPMMKHAGPNMNTDLLAPTPQDAGRGPSHFDWKERSKQIESQVKKRGLKESDYGIMEKGTKVSDDFSWKGYARMICTRLQATMDPALPETCGCPPMDWKGWRIAK